MSEPEVWQWQAEHWVIIDDTDATLPIYTE